MKTKKELLNRISINPNICFGKLWIMQQNGIREYQE